MKTCDICNVQFDGYGNNPQPFHGDTCCDDCNDRFVIPVRMCLGRDFANDSILVLLQTIAEIGSAMREVSAENKFRLRVVPNERNTDTAKPAQES